MIVGTCIICKVNVTPNFIHLPDGTTLHACYECLDKCKEQFVFVCVSCGSVFVRPKEVAEKFDPEIRAGINKLQQKDGLIFGLSECISCPSEGEQIGNA